ncbi:MAG: hypothetical protein ABSA52_25645 [Candidatus Binatia bacterium]|jgi:hypothetical protein
MRLLANFRFGVVVFVLGIALSGVPAWADNFRFSFTNDIGNVPGTVFGEIRGLTNNTTGPATEVIITSFPAGLNSVLGSGPINATLWDQQYQNSFTETGGVVTGGGFWAEQTIGGFGAGAQLYINGESNYNFLNLDGADDLYVYADDGLAAANIQPLLTSAAPTLSVSGLAMTVAVLLLIGIRSRRRRTVR